MLFTCDAAIEAPVAQGSETPVNLTATNKLEQSKDFNITSIARL
jgi:hypothetical protein